MKNSKTVSKKSGPKYIELKGFLSFFILHELSKNPLSGGELARLIGERRNTVLTPGTIYPALKRLRKQKLVFYRREGRNKVYSLSDLGALELKMLYSMFGDLFTGLKSKFK